MSLDFLKNNRITKPVHGILLMKSIHSLGAEWKVAERQH